MRITQSTIYSNFLFDQSRNLNALADVNTQIANGKKFYMAMEILQFIQKH